MKRIFTFLVIGVFMNNASLLAQETGEAPKAPPTASAAVQSAGTGKSLAESRRGFEYRSHSVQLVQWRRSAWQSDTFADTDSTCIASSFK